VPGDEGEDVALLRVTGCGGSTTMVRMAGSGKYTALVRRTKSRRRSFALLRMTGVGEIRRVAEDDRVGEMQRAGQGEPNRPLGFRKTPKV
jgi:hypothetical protein